MRIIDADALLEKYADWVNVYSPKPGGKESLRVVTTQEVRNMPTIDAIPVEWLRRQYHEYMQNNDKLMCDAYAAVMGDWYDWQKGQEAR